MPSISRSRGTLIYLFMNEKRRTSWYVVLFFFTVEWYTTLWDLKKNPPETMDVAFLFWNHKKIGQHLLPLKCLTARLSFGIVFMFLYLFIHSLIHIFWKNRPAFTPLKVRHRNMNFELIYLNVFFDVILFFQLIWFILKQGMTFFCFEIIQ